MMSYRRKKEELGRKTNWIGGYSVQMLWLQTDYAFSLFLPGLEAVCLHLASVENPTESVKLNRVRIRRQHVPQEKKGFPFSIWFVYCSMFCRSDRGRWISFESNSITIPSADPPPYTILFIGQVTPLPPLYSASDCSVRRRKTNMRQSSF